MNSVLPRIEERRYIKNLEKGYRSIYKTSDPTVEDIFVTHFLKV
jgi:hypothetical protein